MFGGLLLSPYVDTSPSDPFGELRGAAIGGIIGFLIGTGVYVYVHGRCLRREDHEARNTPDHT